MVNMEVSSDGNLRFLVNGEDCGVAFTLDSLYKKRAFVRLTADSEVELQEGQAVIKI